MQPATNLCDLELIIEGRGTFVPAGEKAEGNSQDKEVADGSTQPSMGSIE